MNPTREEALFALALEKPIEKHSALLDAVCEGDSALRDTAAMTNSHRRVPAWLGSLLCGFGLITPSMFFAALAAGDQTGAGKSQVVAVAGGGLKSNSSAFRHVKVYA